MLYCKSLWIKAISKCLNVNLSPSHAAPVTAMCVSVWGGYWKSGYTHLSMFCNRILFLDEDDLFDIAFPQCPNLNFTRDFVVPFPLCLPRPPGHDGWKQPQHTISQHCHRTWANESIIWGWWWGTGVIYLYICPAYTLCLTSTPSETAWHIQHP